MYSIMSYWDAEETGASHVDWGLLTYSYNSTPMVHDIAAIQRIYGADTTTRTGDTTYGFNSNAGRDAYDFVATPTPVVAIWDAGGYDTLDLSGYNTPSIIDLNPGSYSSAGGYLAADIPSLAEINANRAAVGLAARSQATYDLYLDLFADGFTNGVMRDNIGIAYGAVVEKAVGGGGDDTITGNNVSNVLIGNGGNDRLAGGNGVDVMTGGSGNDIIEAQIDATKVATKKMGAISIDIITDFDAAGDDLIDLTGLDQAFNFRGTNANKLAGDLSYKSFTSVNGAENALGFDIDGVTGVNDASGPVTVVFANTDGGAADMALVLLNTSSVSADDFLIGAAPTSAAALNPEYLIAA
jgi:Ca2+-binding RTX toxin-like protein